MRKFLKKLIPHQVLIYRASILQKINARKYKGLSSQDIFTTVYAEKVWGDSSNENDDFFSGSGSRDISIISPYINAITNFISSLGNDKPDLMDIGCGDFFIGSKIRGHCNKYIACDIVEPLINFNKQKYKELNVDFRVFDFSTPQYEKVDIITIRQVLQHLSNEDIQKGLKDIFKYCKYLIITEHLPSNNDFIRNKDKKTGPDIRLGLNSGIDIEAKPFSMKNLKSEIICEVSESVGIVRTIVYTSA